MMLNEDNYYVYIVLSQTPTGFGRLIRKVAKLEYNHASIAFDKDLHELYSFGRKQSHVPLVAGFVKEYPERFSLKTNPQVNAKIYKIPVTRQQYILGKKRILQIENDEDEYLYNLFSVLLFPVIHGFSTFKAYSCSEFVIHILGCMNICIKDQKPCWQYTPEEIGDIFEQCLCFEGNLLEYCSSNQNDSEYFFENPGYLTATVGSIKVIARLIFRTICY